MPIDHHASTRVLSASLTALFVHLVAACGGENDDPATTPDDAASGDAAVGPDDPCLRAADDPCFAEAGLVGTWQCVTDELTIGDNGVVTLVNTDGQTATGCMTCEGTFYAHGPTAGSAPALSVVDGTLGVEAEDVATSGWSYCNGLDDVDACGRAPEKGTKSARCYLAAAAPADGGDAGVSDPTVNAPGVKVELVLSEAWTSTGIELAVGDEVSIVAAGEISWYTGVCDECTATPAGGGCPVDDGNFVLPGARCWSLIARVGAQGTPLYVGSEGSFTASEAGELFLGVNDDNFVDNTGAWTAAVDVKPGS